ncbi:MAG: tetratricopeptide repeat protein [Desulfobulbus sp.]|nr:tetratricopeptide repeat protein [Desulfobulbus sp.]
MNGSALGALIAAALIVVYLVWKERGTHRRSKRTTARSDTDAAPPPAESLEPQEREPMPAAADAAETLIAEEMLVSAIRSVDEDAELIDESSVPPSAAGTDGMPPTALFGSAPVLSGHDEVLEDAGPIEAAGAGSIAAVAETAGSAEASPAITEHRDDEAVEPEPPVETAEKPSDESIVQSGLVTALTPSEPDPPEIRFTLDAYASRMHNLEEGKRALLVRAIADQDDDLRDKLQRELVVMTDKLALISDSYAEEVACFQQIMNVFARLREELGERPALAEAIDGLCHGNAEPAEACLAEWSGLSSSLPGKIAFSRGQLAECRVDLQQALILYRQAVALEPDDPRSLHAAGRMARTLYNYQEAILWLESFVRLTRQHGSSNPLALPLAQRELACTYILAGQHQKAGLLYKESMPAMAGKLGPDHYEMGISWFQIGELQEMLGEHDKAAALYRRALEIVEKKKGVEHPSLVPILGKLASLYVEVEMESESVPLYERLVRIREKTLRPNHQQLVIALNSLAESYRLVGRYEDAETCYLKILAINEATDGPDHPSVAAVLQELAKLNINLRRPEEAKQYRSRAAAIFQKSCESSEQKGAGEPLSLEL